MLYLCSKPSVVCNCLKNTFQILYHGIKSLAQTGTSNMLSHFFTLLNSSLWLHSTFSQTIPCRFLTHRGFPVIPFTYQSWSSSDITFSTWHLPPMTLGQLNHSYLCSSIAILTILKPWFNCSLYFKLTVTWMFFY